MTVIIKNIDNGTEEGGQNYISQLITSGDMA